MPMRWLENLPWWAKFPLIVGGALMSAFSNSFPQGFQTAGLILGITIALFGFVAAIWHFWESKFTSRYVLRWPITRKKTSGTIDHPTVSSSPPTLATGLYVCDMRFSLTELSDRHSELTMRVFNGTGRTVEFSGRLSGCIKFNAPNNSDHSSIGNLPTPSMRSDTERTAGQLKEWLLVLAQKVPAPEADRLLAMLEDDIPIHFDLSELMIEICAQDDRQNVARLPIWSGVSYNRGAGFGQIITASIRITG